MAKSVAPRSSYAVSAEAFSAAYYDTELWSAVSNISNINELQSLQVALAKKRFPIWWRFAFVWLASRVIAAFGIVLFLLLVSSPLAYMSGHSSLLRQGAVMLVFLVLFWLLSTHPLIDKIWNRMNQDVNARRGIYNELTHREFLVRLRIEHLECELRDESINT